MKATVLGGDKRMLFAAKELLNDGFEVSIAGFDRLLSLCDIRVTDVDTAVAWADLIILPVRPLKDGVLPTPFGDSVIRIADIADKIGKKPVFTGCGELIRPYMKGSVYDYTACENFTYRNAVLTAEGALGLLISDYEGSVFGSRILVTGFGRIGKVLSRSLSALGAKVTVAARRASDRALASMCGIHAVDYPEVDYGSYDIIINTVPAPVLNQDAVDRMREDVFIIDLASAPGGVDFGRAGERGLSCIHALSLPGKTAPLAAGRIIKDTILNMLTDSALTGRSE